APPPALASAELAAEAAELYWMAVTRDVPFADYETDPLIAAAVEDLGDFPGYAGPTPVTPQNLFRVAYPRVLDRAMVSGFQLQRRRFDGIPTSGRTWAPLPGTTAAGIGFLTCYHEWLCAQRGFPVKDNPFGYSVCPVGAQVFDPKPRFLRSV